jgi:hypothetical protein
MHEFTARPLPRFPRLHVRVLIILGQAGALAAIAASEGPILAALIAGAFTLINTGLTLWLTRRPPRRRRRRPRSRA